MDKKYQTRTVYDIEVEITEAGRALWPDTVKRIAVDKVLHEGRRVSSVAREIDANDNVVRRWVQDARKSQGDTLQLARIEIETGPPQDGFDHQYSEGSFRIQRNGLSIEVPFETSEEHLAKLFRALEREQ